VALNHYRVSWKHRKQSQSLIFLRLSPQSIENSLKGEARNRGSWQYGIWTVCRFSGYLRVFINTINRSLLCKHHEVYREKHCNLSLRGPSRCESRLRYEMVFTIASWKEKSFQKNHKHSLVEVSAKVTPAASHITSRRELLKTVFCHSHKARPTKLSFLFEVSPVG